MVNAFRQLANATRLVGFSVMQFTIALNEKRNACIRFFFFSGERKGNPSNICATYMRKTKRCLYIFLHVRNLRGRPTDVEHRREEAVPRGPHEVRVRPQNGAEKAAAEDRGEGNAHQHRSSDVPQLETAEPIDLKRTYMWHALSKLIKNWFK
jgi:hypothetical protein